MAHRTDDDVAGATPPDSSEATSSQNGQDSGQHSAEVYRRMLRNVGQIAGIGMWEWNLQTGELTWSDAMYDILGFDREDGPQSLEKFIEIVHPDDRVKVEQLAAELEKDGRFELETRVLPADGSEQRTVRAMVELTTDESGKPWLHSGLAFDVTDRRQAEGRLRDSENRLKALSDASFEAIFLSDKGLCLDQNRTAERMFGYTLEAAVGRMGTEWIAPEDRERVMNAMISGYEEPYEVTALRKDGSTFPAEIQGRMFEYNGRQIRVTALRDITARKQTEEELRLKELIFDASLAAMITMDVDGVITDVNQAWLEQSRYKDKSEVVGRKADELFANDRDAKFVRECLIDEGRWQGEYSRLRADGTSATAFGMGFELRNQRGELVGYCASLLDLTARIAAEREAREAARRLEEAQRLVHVGSWEWRFDEDVVRCSDELIRIVGAESDDGLVKFDEAMESTHPDDREAFQVALQAVRETGKRSTAEFRVVRSNGESAYLYTVVEPLMDDQGRAVGIFGTSQDITQLKTAEIALRNAKLEVETILDHLPNYVMLHDREMRITWANRAACEWIGLSREEISGKLCTDLWHRNEQECEQCPVREAMQTGQPHARERRRDDGRTFRVYGCPIPDHLGNTTHTVEVVDDITETTRLRELESRAERLEMAGTIAGQVAHDFNNLLAPIMAYPELILAEIPEDSPARMYLSDIEVAARKISEINQDLLTMGRRGHYNQEVLNLNEIVRQAVAEITPVGDTISCDLNLDESLLKIKGGEAQIHRMLSNLLHNAIDALHGVGRIVVKTENYYVDNTALAYSRVPKGEYVKLRVSDTGCGIPSDVIGKILDPFFTTKTTDKKRGSGLGLSVVDAVVKDHDGYLDISSTVGEGTSFHVYFPITRETADGTRTPDTAGGSESILVVDDDDVQRTVTTRLLEALGYRVAAAASGEQAVDMVARAQYDLLILDMIMPGGIDGTETYRRIHKSHPTQKAIIVSGYSETKRVLDAQRLGAGAFVRKPFTKSSLSLAVRHELDKKQAD